MMCTTGADLEDIPVSLEGRQGYVLNYPRLAAVNRGSFEFRLHA